MNENMYIDGLVENCSNSIDNALDFIAVLH